MSVFSRISRRKRSLASVASVTAATLIVTTMAVLYQGVTTADVDLNDAGVWVTRPTALLTGRLNYPSEVLDAGLFAKSKDFDVEQEAGTVILHDQGSATLAIINTSSVSLNKDVTVPAGSASALGGGMIAVLDPSAGALWVRAANAIDSLSVEADDPNAELGGGAVATVATDGTTFAFSTEDAELVTIQPNGSPSTSSVSGFADDATVAISAVGTTPILLDTTNGLISIGGAAPIELGVTDGLALQEPSAAGDAVAISNNGALLMQPLDGSSARSIDAGGSGVAVTPVTVNGCTYAAWTGSGEYVRDCAGTANDIRRAVENLAGDKRAVFRVNRNAVVLNELTEGLVLMVNQNMKEVSNWDEVTPPMEESDDLDEDDSSQQQIQDSIPVRAAENNPPVAEDDEFGVRAGRTIILPVLDNDNDPDGDVLTSSVLGAMPSIGAIEPIYGGGALQVRVNADASGTAEFSYTAADGRGLTDDAVVILTVKPTGTNELPVQKREGRIAIEQGASLSYNVLPDWIDPDGDDLFLSNASVLSDDQVQYRADGLVTFNAIGAEQGRKDVRLIVSDGIDVVEGVLHVDVRPPGTLKPVTNADHVTTLADQPVTVSPLGNDLSPSGNRLTLGKVDEVPGATVVPDYTAGTFTFTATEPKSYYVQYTAAEGQQQEVGLVRVDVLPSSVRSQNPVAVRDVALLPAGGDVLVDVLQNDSDPDGGLLVVQSVTVEPASGVAVAILEHAVLRVTDQPGITAPVTFTYTISNGTGPATGEVLVVPVPAPATLQPPLATDDSAIVRAGDTVTVDVLANDISPGGDTLTVVPALVAPLPDAADGITFVSQNTLRFKAGETAKTVYVTYEAIDSSGQKDAGYVSIQILPLNETNNPPRPANVEARALAGTTIRIPVPLDGVDPDGDSVTLVGQASAPGKGRIDEVGDDFLTYTAFDDAAGTDAFRYEVRDALGLTNSATIRVGVAPAGAQNQAPDAVKDVITAQPGRRVAVDVLANDTDPDGDTLSLADDALTVSEGVEATIAGGRVVVTTPDATGDYAIQYTVGDTRGAIAIGSLLVTVANEAALLPPIARDDVVTAARIGEADTVDVPVLKNDDDPDGVASELVVALLGEPEGAAVGEAGVVTVTPSDSVQVITYTATDADQQIGTAFIRVPALASTPPSLKPGVPPLEVKAGEQATVPLTDYVVAPEGKSVRLTQPDKISAIHSADGVYVKDETTLLYTAAPDYFGSDALTFEVTDGTGPDDPEGIKATLSIPITVLPPENQPPTFAGGAMQVAPGEKASTLDLRALSADPDKGDLEKLSYSVSGPSGGLSASVSGSILSVSADESVAKGTKTTLNVTVTDGTTEPVQGSVIVTISASTRPLTVANDDTVAKAPQGKAATVSVLGNDVNPFPETPLALVGTPLVDTPAAGGAQYDGDAVVVTPGSTFVGTMVVRYQVGDATKDPDRYVFGTIRLTVQGKPAAPGTPSVSSVQDKTVVLSWSDGSNNGAEITNHKVEWNGGSQDCASTTCTITGLTNDVEYAFTATAINEVGESDPSPASAVARPDARPSAPTITSLDFGDGSLTVTWADGANPGSAITEYNIQIGGAGTGYETVPAGTRTKQLTGLKNGSQYSVQVRAKNKVKDPSDWSGPMSMSPAGSPSAPAAPIVGPAAQLGTETQLPVTWIAPTFNSEVLTGYTLVIKTGGSTFRTLELGPDVLAQNIAVPNSEVAYTFAVAAKNKSTDANKTTVDFSADSAARRAVGKPGTPTITNAEDGDNAIKNVTWTAGVGNGASGSEISFYYDLNGDGIDRPASANLTSGISNNNTYSIRIRAIATVEGTPYPGDWSAPRGGLAPYGPVQSPVVTSTSGATNVTFNWTAPSPNGRAIATILINIDNAGWQDRGPGNGGESAGNGYSQGHSIRVKAVDSNGRESAEATSSSTSGPQPPPVVIASWGANAGVVTGCSSGNCPYVNMSASNATPGAVYTVIWYCGNADAAANCGSGNEMYRTTATADGAGDFAINNRVFFGYRGTVWVVIHGDRGPVESNRISR